MKVARATFIVAGGNPRPPPLNDSPVTINIWWHLKAQLREKASLPVSMCLLKMSLLKLPLV